LCKTGVMHLVPPERAGRRIIDEDRVCQAIEVIGKQETITLLAQRFAILGDPSRLALLLAIRGAGPISVSDLAVATDLNDTTVSQALRLLRAAGVVGADRDGRVLRYHLTDETVLALLDQIGPPTKKKHRAASR
jgi:ArsR family transcriptional regulator, lead/cadmium/zinc/bismuth-responsive transcriptional repressor